MHAAVLVAILCVTPTTGKVLITTTARGQAALIVADWTVDGNIVRVTALDGTPQTMRLERVDLEASERATAARADKAEADRVMVEIQRQAAEQAASERAERKVAAAMRPKRRGSMSVAGGSAANDVAKGAPAISAGGTQAAKGAWAPKVQALQSKLAAARANVASLTARHDSIADKHNKSDNYVERDVDRAQLATLREQISTAQASIPGIEKELADTQEQARKSGADAWEWNR